MHKSARTLSVFRFALTCTWQGGNLVELYYVHMWLALIRHVLCLMLNLLFLWNRHFLVFWHQWNFYVKRFWFILGHFFNRAWKWCVSIWDRCHFPKLKPHWMHEMWMLSVVIDDAAECCESLSVGLSVCNALGFCKNGLMDQCPVWSGDPCFGDPTEGTFRHGYCSPVVSGRVTE